jgi:hypothetical protein
MDFIYADSVSEKKQKSWDLKNIHRGVIDIYVK